MSDELRKAAEEILSLPPPTLDTESLLARLWRIDCKLRKALGGQAGRDPASGAKPTRPGAEYASPRPVCTECGEDWHTRDDCPELDEDYYYYTTPDPVGHQL